MRHGTARIVINYMDKKTVAFIVGGIALVSGFMWIVLSQGMGVSFEMLEP